MSAFFVILLFLLAGVTSAQTIQTVDEAWAQLNRSDATIDAILQTQDGQNALNLLRQNPTEVTHLILRTLSFGGEKLKAESLAALLIKKTDFLQMVRAIVSTYPPLEKSTPFIGTVAAIGEAQDMKFITPWIVDNPNSDGSCGLAIAMSENSNAYETLRELAKIAPGRWNDLPQVREVLKQVASGEIEHKPFAPTPSGFDPPGTKTSNRAAESVGAARAESRWSHQFWASLGAATVLMIAYGLAVRRRRQQGRNKPVRS